MKGKDPGDLNVCDRCIGDKFVEQKILDNGRLAQCNFCGRKRKRKCLTIAQLSDIVDLVFRENYATAGEEPYVSEDSDNIQYRAAGEDAPNIISEMLEADFDVAKAIDSYLTQNTYVDIKHGEEPFWGTDEGYQEITSSDYEYQEVWDIFRETLQHDARFFNHNASGHLSEIFKGVGSKADSENNPIYEIGPGKKVQNVFRARIIKGRADLSRFASDPARELGPPPKTLARAGRMNPAGVPVFYGALDEHTCIAELRLAVGESAMVAKFQLARRLRVFDFTRFDRPQGILSMFDPAFQSLVSQRAFLRHLKDEICKPIRPTDEEINYVPTQAVAEFLAKVHDPPIDALIYGSAQTKDRKNIVILNHAATVKVPKRRREADEEIHEYEDGITIFKPQPRTKHPMMQILRGPKPSKDPGNASKPTLKVAPDSIQVISADSITYDTTSKSINIYKVPVRSSRAKF